jgi:catechol 2,3-dioxygenase-like lactoylglutathione lyase family enzyme
MYESLQGLGAITLFVNNLARSRSFYSDVFGLAVVYEDDNSAAFGFGNTIINLLVNAEAIEMIKPAAVADNSVGARYQLSIWVDDVDGVCTELGARGVTLINGPIDQPWGKRTAVFADPDNNLWELAQDLLR